MPENQRICIHVVIVFLLLGAFSCPTDLIAETPPLWGDLEVGPYEVGFRTLEKYDYSRVFRSKYDYFGTLQPGERARPLQVCIWYPAEVTDDATKMVYGEYLFPNPEDTRFFAFVTELQNREIGFLHYLFHNDQGLVLDVMNIAMAAIRNATPADSAFPLIIYHPNVSSAFSENLVMCEFLASHGFVVATTHSVGTTTLNSQADQADLETQIRDKELAFAQVRDLEFVDNNKLGVFGLGCGGLAALIMQMRNPDVDAVASVDGWNVHSDRFEFVTQSPFFNARRMNIPLLQMYRDEEQSYDLTLVDSCKYSDRCLLGFKTMSRIGFSSYGAIWEIMSDSVNTPPRVSRPGYDIACRYLLNFFNAYLNKDEMSLKFVNSQPVDNGIDTDLLSLKLLSGGELPPTGVQFVNIIREHGAHKAVEIYDKFKLSDPGSITFPEATLNILGYQFLQTGRSEEAIEIFKLNAEAYPNSANCWDSYADGCIANGDHERAIQCYKKVLEVLPSDSLAGEQLKETLRNNAQEGIKRLEE